VFGLSVSILFLSLWGRAVVVDSDTLAESLSPLADSELVSDIMSNWMSNELVGSGADPTVVEPTIDYLFASSSVGDTLDQLVGEIVRASASGDPDGARVDVAALVSPTVPELTVALVDLGYPASQSHIAEVVGSLDPLVVRPPGSVPIVGPGSPTATRLGTAALLASVAIIGSGLGVVALSEDRVGAVRSLASRVAIGGLSFAVFLRLGSWVLDPQGGRAPVPESLSALAGSKWAVPLEVAFVAGLIAGGIYVVRRQLRRGGVSRSVDEPPTQQSVRPMSRSESR
jgi:hypothetical protein